MPLLYGEGKKAFRRLQEAIIEDSADHSILAFRDPQAQPRFMTAYSPVLAPSISCFCDDIRPEWCTDSGALRLENGNITLNTFVLALRGANDGVVNPYAPSHVAYLDCVFEDDYLSRPALLLRQVYNPKRGMYKRCSELPVTLKATAVGSVQHAVVAGSDVVFDSEYIGLNRTLGCF